MKFVIIITISVVFLFVPISVHAEEVPNWIKNNAGWFSEGVISDSDFTDVLAYLIDEGVLVIESELSPKTERVIPDWIKNNAKWWADGSIDDSSFFQGVEYMAKSGILGNDIPKQSKISNVMEVIKESNEFGVKITWKNHDSKSHTVTLGNPVEDHYGEFDSGLLSSGQISSMILSDIVSFDYFCMVHPWEQETIIVSSNDLEVHYDFLEKYGYNDEIKELPELQLDDLESSKNITDSIFTVTKNDMIPALEFNDKVFADKNVPFEDIKVGDIIVDWRQRGDLDRVTIHRVFDIISIDPMTVQTKADTYPSTVLDTFVITEEFYLGKVTAKILTNYENAYDIKNKFISSLIETLSAEATEKDLEDFRIFIGEERSQKLQDFNEKYGAGFSPEMSMPSEIDVDLTLEEEFFAIEIVEYWLEFFKQEMSERFIEIDNSFDDATQQINDLNISEEEKLQHIKEIRDKKTAYVSGSISGMKNLILIEEEIIQKKKELELEAELRGKSIEFDNPICGEGTIMKNGQCVVDTSKSSKGGGCLIATATYGSELAPQVQQLRELRYNKLLQTEAGTSFINSFNDFYYSFSPYIADYERENPIFKEMVKIAITPMLSTLTIMNYAEDGSESQVLVLGLSVIILNLGMYVTTPVFVGFKITKYCRQRKLAS